MYIDLSDVNESLLSNVNSYIKIESNSYISYYYGYAIYNKNNNIKQSFEIISEGVINQNIDFNKIIGAYRIIIFDRKNEKTYFFCDNAGFLCLFYNADEIKIADSFIEIIKNCKKVLPNYPAIAEFLNFNCIYSTETLFREVCRTNPSYYYVFSNNVISEYSKNILDFGHLNSYDSLHEIVGCQLEATKHKNKIAIITGGTDSRAVLANIESYEEHLDLMISGNNNHIDVSIANEIADKLNRKLYIAEPKKIIDENYVNELFMFSDGMVGLVNINRLFQKILIEKENNIEFEFGGIAGEFYKNSFLFGEKNKSDSEINYENMTKSHFALYENIKHFLHENIIKYHNEIFESKYKIVSKFKGKNKLQVYTNMGYFWLQCRMITFSNSQAKYATTISPLMERDCVALVYNKNPKELEMQIFQRNEVTTYCPKIADIKTDRGLTLSTNKKQMVADGFKNAMYYAKIITNKLMKKSVENDDEFIIYKQVLNLKLAQLALEKCKEMNIIRADTNFKNIPNTIAERILTVGMVLNLKNDGSNKW